MKNKKKSNKEELTIQGKKYKMDKIIADTIKSLADAIRAHEVALLTWVHKDFIGKGLKKKDKNEFRESLSKYCLSIPDAENILKRMDEMDKQVKEQNKKEKAVEAKD